MTYQQVQANERQANEIEQQVKTNTAIINRITTDLTWLRANAEKAEKDNDKAHKDIIELLHRHMGIKGGKIE